MKPQLFYVGLKAFISKEGKLLILQGSSQMEKEGLWGLPGGRIDDNETQEDIITTLRREVIEECGDVVENIESPFLCVEMVIPKGEIFLVGFRATYNGKNIALAPEHKKYHWLDSNEDLNLYQFIPGYKEKIEEFFRMR